MKTLQILDRIDRLIATEQSRPEREPWEFDEEDQFAIFVKEPESPDGAISILFSADWGTLEDREMMCLMKNNAAELIRLARVGYYHEPHAPAR